MLGGKFVGGFHFQVAGDKLQAVEVRFLLVWQVQACGVSVSATERTSRQSGFDKDWFQKLGSTLLRFANSQDFNNSFTNINL